jgi:hypothetical protein
MKFRFLAMILALSLLAWAQESPSTSAPNATPKPEANSCCHHASDMKNGAGCCSHASADAKDAAGCCGGAKCQTKAGKSCCAGMATADAKSFNGKDMKKCMKQCKKNGGCADGKCWGGEKSAMNCCGTKCEHAVHAASAS